MKQLVLTKTQIARSHRLRAVLAMLGGAIVAATASSAQSSSALNGPWSGQAQCTLTVQGPGYSEKEVHTWTLSGGAPTLQGAMHVFQATWSVTGQGSVQRSQGSQTYQAQWTMNASRSNAPIAIFVRASDGRIIMNAWHAQLRAPGGVTGTQQVTINGVPQTPGTINLEAFEWQFPAAGTSIDSTTTNPQFSGSKTTATNGSVGPMQTGGSQGTAQCSWQFSAGAGSTPITPGTNPTVTTGASSSITNTTAVISGSVNPNGADTHFVFAYGTSSTLSGAVKTTSVDLGSGTTPVGVSVNLTGLTAGATYYYQVQATGSAGTTNDGVINSFTTASTTGALPATTTGAASSIAATTATISGSVNPNGADTHFVFAYGTDSTLSGAGNTISVDAGAGTTPVGVSVNLRSLTAGTTYYYQLQATDSAGTANGVINSFTTTSASDSSTQQPPPGVDTGKKLSPQAQADNCSPPNNPNWGTFSPLCFQQGDQNVVMTLSATSAPGTSYIQGATAVKPDDGVTVLSMQVNSPNKLTVTLNISPTARQGAHAFWVEESSANGNYLVQSPFILVFPASQSHTSQ